MKLTFRIDRNDFEIRAATENTRKCHATGERFATEAFRRVNPPGSAANGQ
jgi:hypothetical protein